MSVPERIERVVLRRVRSPLRVPYKLSLGAVTAFDTILVEAVTGAGARGWGEATVLTGYTDETIDQAWDTACRVAPELVGAPLASGIARAGAIHAAAPFTATALASALEMAGGHPALDVATPLRTPLLAVVNATDRGAIDEEIDQRLGEGFTTLKVKVGFELAPDLERVAYIQARVGARASLRVDANQGYTQADAVRFVEALDPRGIELVEQTCAAGDWPAAVAVAHAARPRGIAMMLDESIYGDEEIDRAGELGCADVIKLKLMKAGGLDALAHGLDRIRRRGMRPVLGNGVAGEVGCWMEACVAARSLDGAGEMNGFLKTREPLFQVPMRLDAGALVLTPGTGGEAVTPLRDALDAHTLATRDLH